jgi:arginyl-tRNA synthetase
MKNKDIIIKILTEATKDLLVDHKDIVVTFSNDFSNGDYASNIAFVCSKPLKIAPKVLAEQIVSKVNEIGLPKEFSKVEVAGAGFINFFLSDSYLKDIVSHIVKEGESFGKLDIHSGKKILIEHSSPNLFKPFHIGHLMNNAIGESITRLAEYSGATITKISYPSDISLGIGKAIWAMMHSDIILDSLPTIKEKIAFLGDSYVKGTNAFKDNEDIQKEVRVITQKLFDGEKSPELDMYLACKEINLAYFKEVVERLGSQFDAFIYESEAGIEGEKLVRAHIGDIFKESEGAVIYEGEVEGLHTRVFINKEGYPTYEAKDVGLLSLKFKKYNPDISVFVTDHEQKAYFEVVSSAAGKINPLWSEKTVHRTHGRMSFKGQKMSSRLGGVPLASDTIDTISEDVQEKAPTLDNENKEIISISAIKFAILRVMAGKNINFDPETSLSFEGDSGPYLQYTAVRALSVLNKAKEANLLNDAVEEVTDRVVADVERVLVKFPEVVELAVTEWSPHYITTYLLELAQAFNSWYGNTKIIDPINPSLQHNLRIAQAVHTTIKNGLYVLGIKTPSFM